MDIRSIAGKLGLAGSNQVVRKAEELRRQADIQFDSSVMGVGEICKAIICLEIAAAKLQVIFDRQAAINICGMSEKAYIRSFNGIQNSIGIKYKSRFLAALPPSRRMNTDVSRPVFTAVAFYLCAKKNKLKVDKGKLIELCATSESEFTSVSNSMKDLCFDIFGISKEKAKPNSLKGNRDLVDVLPSKRMHEDDNASESSVDVDDELELPTYKRKKKMEKLEYEEWKSEVMASNKEGESKDLFKRKKQSKLNFSGKVAHTSTFEA